MTETNSTTSNIRVAINGRPPCWSNGLIKTNTFVGIDGKRHETTLDVTEKTVCISEEELERRNEERRAKKQQALERVRRGMVPRDHNTTLPTTKDMAMVAAIAGAEVDVKV